MERRQPLSPRRIANSSMATTSPLARRSLPWAIIRFAMGVRRLLVIGSMAVSAFANPLRAGENWPHWRGPQADGTAPNADPPIKWDGVSGSNIRWKAELKGRGSATPIIWENQIFVVSAESTDRQALPDELPQSRQGIERLTEAPTNFYRFLVSSFERSTGKLLWQRVATEDIPHEGHHPSHSYAAGSPTTDGQRLYVSFGSFGIFCYDLQGRLLWERQLGRLTTRRGWGEAVTPVVFRGKLLLNWDQEVDSALYCLDALTGATIWRAARDEVTTWTTPLVSEFAGSTQVVLNGTRSVRSHNLENGEVVWNCTGMTVNAIPSLIRYRDSVVAMSGYQGHKAISVPLTARGDLDHGEVLNWQYSTGTPYVPSPTLVGDHIYFTAANSNLLTALDAVTGRPQLDRVRLPGVRQFYASPIFAGGRVYFTDRDGVTIVLNPGAELAVIATNSLGDPVDASPAAVGRQLFLRGEKYLYCLEAAE